jgi:hypothetical protein
MSRARRTPQTGVRSVVLAVLATLLVLSGTGWWSTRMMHRAAANAGSGDPPGLCVVVLLRGDARTAAPEHPPGRCLLVRADQQPAGPARPYRTCRICTR